MRRMQHPLSGAYPPPWADGWGQDRYGVFVEIEVGAVRMTLRWIQGGTFWMGSPKGESGRLDWEWPRHRVTLSEGFWLAETPCTQELWLEVMGESPSEFQSAQRPVEMVSWEDAGAFMERVNERRPGLDLQLPTEAQWERACRAGTDTATWLGDLEILGERNAPLLDGIAWYGGNSGVEFDLGQGRDSRDWKETQYPSELSGTRLVKEKASNPWGLYDMLGNVFEWCRDTGYRPKSTDSDPRKDPCVREGGTGRVIRGGSWFEHARLVRAASRRWGRPGDRRSSLGFRLSRGPDSRAEHKKRSSSEQARRGTSLRAGARHSNAWLERLPWAADGGEDRYGRWVLFGAGGVGQRMRWIVPGTFLMGSPDNEAGRRDREGPRHEVTLSQGFWLAETPCTQELWEAVMGSNPSEFRSLQRPVERVSWEDVQAFLTRLETRLPGLNPRLPTEAEWEYACRTDTETATWLGDLKILGERNAPLLDEMAWYGGNSGVEFDLPEGWDSSGWEERQYPHQKAGTREVALKTANPWGLFDMLGNVYEWCSDRYGPYVDGPALDPQGPEKGSARVIRGGSWLELAQNVRAAYRSWCLPVVRLSLLGFRLSRGPSQELRGAEPSAGSGGSGEQSEGRAGARSPAG